MTDPIRDAAEAVPLLERLIALVFFIAYVMAARDRTEREQTAHYIVVPETNHGEWECR